MKKSLLLVVLFCFLAANTVLAQGKTAVIDMQAVTLQSKAGMKAVEESYEQFVEIVAEGRDMSVAEVKKLADSINKQKASLSTAALQDKNIELNKKSVELERLQKDLQTELQTKQAIKLDELFKELEQYGH